MVDYESIRMTLCNPTASLHLNQCLYVAHSAKRVPREPAKLSDLLRFVYNPNVAVARARGAFTFGTSFCV